MEVVALTSLVVEGDLDALVVVERAGYWVKICFISVE